MKGWSMITSTDLKLFICSKTTRFVLTELSEKTRLNYGVTG